MTTETEGNKQRGRPKKNWWDCVRADVESFGLSIEDAQDRHQWTRTINEKTS